MRCASRPVSFPLDDDKIAVTVTELGLPWELSADECLSYSEDQRTCVLRDTTETYAEGGSKLLRAAISSGNSGGGDYMFARRRRKSRNLTGLIGKSSCA